MEINAAKVVWHKIFCGKPSFVDKQKMNGKKFGELSTEEIQEIRDNVVPATTKSHKGRNENIQWYVSGKFRDFTPAFMKIR